MSVELRIALIAGAILTMAYFLGQIRRDRLQIGYAVSWSVFSIVIILLAIFPEIVELSAQLLGVASPVNLLYLVILFCLIIKLFSITVKLSKLNRQITELTQKIALNKADDEHI